MPLLNNNIELMSDVPGMMIEHWDDGTATYTVYVDGIRGWMAAISRALQAVAQNMGEFRAITYAHATTTHKREWTFTFFAR